MNMAINLKLPKRLTSKQEQWVLTHVGPRMYYLHNRYGGVGWSVKLVSSFGESSYWELTLEDEQLASFFVIKFL